MPEPAVVASTTPTPPPPPPAPPAVTDEIPAAHLDEKLPISEPVVAEIANEPGHEIDDPPPPFSPFSDGDFFSNEATDAMLEEELERRWILNLSMHFRDRSEREKFFVTFAETPTRWRRLTISCDYRDAPPDSLEQDLKGLRYQREKSARIYEAIRDSLPDIQFYDTVTNLKLQTTDGRLHVHVTQDMNETIPYPPVSAVKHLDCPRYRERSVEFDSHLSGFVYKVTVNGGVLIKKEIPGPDAVDEFLYEINALHSLRDARSVIRFGGVIVDDEGETVKGLLIGFASQGALIDLLYEEKGRLSWPRRQRWAYQIVQGLSEIHEAGFVQGDLTLSNVVVDAQDHAKIIDINRRGCPIGWEPPEMSALIDSNQKLSMYIGVKSDLYQLGMVLWALAMQHDEPEMQRRPLRLGNESGDVPEWFRRIVEACLAERPQGRPLAKELLGWFPASVVSLAQQGDAGGVVGCGDDGLSRPANSSSIEMGVFKDDGLDDPPPPFEERPQESRHTERRGRSMVTQHSILSGHDSPIPRRSMSIDSRQGTKDLESSSSPEDDRPAAATREAVHHILPLSPDADMLLIQPQIVTIAPPDSIDGDGGSGGGDTDPRNRWEEVEIEGHAYLVNRHSLDLLRASDDDDEDDVNHNNNDDGGHRERRKEQEEQKDDGGSGDGDGGSGGSELAATLNMGMHLEDTRALATTKTSTMMMTTMTTTTTTATATCKEEPDDLTASPIVIDYHQPQEQQPEEQPEEQDQTPTEEEGKEKKGEMSTEVEVGVGVGVEIGGFGQREEGGTEKEKGKGIDALKF